jgi:CBS-domain-containing membrane protein
VLVRELLSRDVTTVGEDTELDVAVHLLAERHVSALPVVDADAHVVGILSEADVLRLHLAADPRARLGRSGTAPSPAPWPRTVREVMSADPVVAHEGSDVSVVAQVLADTGWKSLPVVDDERVLVGMVSRSDMIRALSTDDEAIRRRLVHDLADLGLSGWEVSVLHGVVSLRGNGSARDAGAASDLAATAPGVREVVLEPDPAAG